MGIGLFEIIILFMLIMVVGLAVLVYRGITGSLGRRSSSHELQGRLDKLQAEVERLALADRGTRPDYLGEEVHRLDERVDFLEKLLAERPKSRSLPRDDNG